MSSLIFSVFSLNTFVLVWMIPFGLSSAAWYLHSLHFQTPFHYVKVFHSIIEFVEATYKCDYKLQHKGLK